MMDGDRSILKLDPGDSALHEVFRDEMFVGNADEFCALPPPVDAESLESLSCRAGHTACYISPYGELYPRVQFCLSCGNLRPQRFIDIWRDSEQPKEVRSIRWKDLSGCSQCAHGSACAPLSRLGLHGRKRARTFYRGLKNPSPDRHSLG
jgi:radical SAM protein with 4Fe4S-binding SPASM domain